VIQAVQMTMSVSTLKLVLGFMEILQSNNAYITPHEWLPNIWDVRTIGFLSQYSPNHYPKEATTKDLNALFKNDTAMPQYCLKRTVISSLINQTESNVTMSNTEEKVKQQQEIIKTQGRKIDEILAMFQEMKSKWKRRLTFSHS
jgi:hypothetical protein